MKPIFLALTCLYTSSIAFAWGAPNLLPASDRTTSYEIVTKLDKKKSFQKIAVWAAKTFANANDSIKLKDSELGVLIAKGNLPCKALKIGNGYAEDQRIDFTLEISSEAKKTEIKISELVGRADGAYDDAARPSNKAEMEAAKKECLDPFVDQIKKELQ